MKSARNLLGLLRGAAGPAFALAIISFFGGYALFGSNGVLAWGEYSQRHAERKVQLVAIEKQRAVLAHRVELLDPQSADLDLADELARRDLGLVQPDEVIIPMN